MNKLFKSFLPHLLACVVALVLFFVYFSPVLSGKTIFQSDVLQVKGSLHEAETYMKQTGEEILWSNSSFAGMPVWRGYSNNWLRFIHNALNTLPQPVLLTFLSFLGFYILLLAYRANIWLAFLGGLAFAFSTFNFISIEAGHVNKVYDMALMAPVLAGVVLTLRGKYWLGAAVTLLFLGLQIFYGHVQISYYLMIMIGILFLVELISPILSGVLDATENATGRGKGLIILAEIGKRIIKEKTWLPLVKPSLILLVILGISVLPNASRLWTTAEYGKSTPRNGAVLTPANKPKQTGLDKDYAYRWSNGLAEPMTFFIPSFYGGGSNEEWSSKTETYKFLEQNQALDALRQFAHYWGEQPFTGGPIYFGAIVCFLFVLGLIVVKERVRWWLLIVAVLSIMLSYGKNLSWFNDFMFHYIPLYNKFRSVTMTVSMTQLAFPLLGFLALKKIFSGELTEKETWNGIKWATIITGGLALLLCLLSGVFFDFVTSQEREIIARQPEYAAVFKAVKSDRELWLRMDAFRSLFFVIATAGLLWAYNTQKIKATVVYVALGLLIVLDLWGVNKRYVNDENFKDVKKLERQMFVTSPADEEILKDKDPYFRVFNLTQDPRGDAITSYHHKSLGGYSAIKLTRYEDLLDSCILQGNQQVLNMLNTKYLIQPNQQRTALIAIPNLGALGHAWFVKEFRMVNTPDEALKGLKTFNAAQTAYVEAEFASQLNGLTISQDSASTIKLTSYHPNKLAYDAQTQGEKLAVFSDIYYQPGWNAYIDGKLVSHMRVNYVLRGLRIPAGNHKIEFRFEPESYYTGEKFALFGSVIFYIVLLGLFGKVLLDFIKSPEKTVESETPKKVEEKTEPIKKAKK